MKLTKSYAKLFDSGRGSSAGYRSGGLVAPIRIDGRSCDPVREMSLAVAANMQDAILLGAERAEHRWLPLAFSVLLFNVTFNSRRSTLRFFEVLDDKAPGTDELSWEKVRIGSWPYFACASTLDFSTLRSLSIPD